MSISLSCSLNFLILSNTIVLCSLPNNEFMNFFWLVVMYVHLFSVNSCIRAMSSAFISFLIFSLIYLYHPILSVIHLLLHFMLMCSIAAANFVFILVISMLYSMINAGVMLAPMFDLAVLISCLNFLRSLS